jgi:ATP-dependent RNA helicase RhlE
MSNSNTATSAGFPQFALRPELQRAIAAMGFTAPRPIQSQTIPAALEGRDVLGLAQTGTGKTAAFALPILERLLAVRKEGPRALILAPTRELASQISAEIQSLARFGRVKITTLFGGVSARPQITALRARPDILVACPGRLLDLMQQGAVRLQGVEVLVLDEADHMFDMGFLPDVKRILSALPRQRQNLLFSATMPREIRGLADGILNKPVVAELNAAPLTTIEHALYPVGDKEKLTLLNRVLADDDFVSAIVFTRTKHRARRLAQQLDRSGHRAVALQGNMSQNARDRAMNGFRKRQYDVLVATDIAARGIDVEQISHVINYDMPGTPDAYTHRIGRTGRAEREGRAYTFVTADDRDMVREVERKLGTPIPRRNIEGMEIATFPDSQDSSPRPRRASRGPAYGRPAGNRPRRPAARRGGVGRRS